MKAPRYQELPASRIPVAYSAAGDVEVRVIAGTAYGVQGAVETHIPIQYLHFKLQPGAKLEHDVPRSLNAMLYVISGEVTAGEERVPEFRLVALANDGDTISIASATGAEILLIAAQPINEPVARYGPFVMNTQHELQQAFEDFHAGRMGSIAVPR
jgi:hypothetical protein